MKRRMHLPCSLLEGAATLIGGLLIAIVLGFIVPLALPIGAPFVVTPITREIGFVLALIAVAASMYGLIRGLIRHGNGTPLLLTFLGAVCLWLSVSTFGSNALSLLGATAVLTAIPWSILQKTIGLVQTETPTLDMETFLNSSHFQ